MMAYDSDFVLCILHDGSPVREINGKASIPFSSEYKIRLKNKHSHLRAKARVWVDGRKASGLGDFILHPGETLDLERFLDESMTSGRRFQFVPLSDSRVNDPTDSANGLIKVEFYREAQNVNWNKIVIEPPRPHKPWTPPYDPFRPSWTGDGLIGGRTTVGSRGSTSSCHNVSYTSSLASQNIAPASAGATVEGGHSGQSFVYGNDFQTEVYPITLTLRLKGTYVPSYRQYRTQQNPIVKDVNQARPSYHKERFCGSCGKRRSRMTDRFCGRCGTSYQQVG